MKEDSVNWVIAFEEYAAMKGWSHNTIKVYCRMSNNVRKTVTSPVEQILGKHFETTMINNLQKTISI